MRWSVIGLIGLGVLAAAGSAVLMAVFRARMRGPVARGPTTQKAETVQVVVAAEDIKPMTVINAEHVQTRQVPKAEAPEGYIGDPVRVVGKVVSVGMLRAQPFSSKYFAGDGTGPQLAASVTPGKRAFSLPILRQSGLEGLLYPGCLVDVLASFRVSGVNAEEAGEAPVKDAISTVLMREIPVLAVGTRTVVSDPGEQPKVGESSGGRYSQKGTVTLLVDPAQAEALQLAMEYGSIKLTIRNPLDITDRGGRQAKATFLSQISDDLARVLSDLRKRTHAAPGVRTSPRGDSSKVAVELPTNVDANIANVAAPPPQWVTMVIRGGKVYRQVFNLEQQKEAVVKEERKQ